MIPWIDVLDGQVEADTLAQAEAVDPKALDEWVVKNVEADALRRALSLYYEVPALNLEGYPPEPEVLELVAERRARELGVLPLFQQKNRLFVAFADPDNTKIRDLLAQDTGLMIQAVAALQTDIDTALTRCYSASGQTGENLRQLAATQEKRSDQKQQVVLDSDSKTPAAQIWQQIFSQAYRLKASDVHLHPFPNRIEMRYRLDGVLQDFAGPPVDIYLALVSRLKLDCNLDIAERRLPQDGRSQIIVDGKACDLRVSILPTLHGEGIVVRLLPGEAAKMSLDNLGFPPDIKERYDRLVRLPHGMMLVTGPTGSGKSTTLYATLEQIKTPEIHILTLEDPVEARIDGVTQVQVKPDINFTFATGLRSVLRHDPDIVMVGEIRDLESAEIAIRAALTGHYMLSTLHTNNSLQAVTRLVDIGVDAYLVRAVVRGILAQRLVRRVCQKCRVTRSVTPEDLAQLGLGEAPEGAIMADPIGCDACGGRGYKGRVGVYELLEFTPEMRRLSDKEMTPERLGDLAREHGFRTLREEACRLVFAGETSIREALRITLED